MPSTLSIYETYKNRIELMREYQEAYDSGFPLISDKEWDDYYFGLLEFEKRVGWADPMSPTQQITFDLMSELQKVNHNHPMLSLAKTKDIADLDKFLIDRDWICMAKMDGLTCSLTYKQGKLVRAETRGNGFVGEDITHNARVILSIPKNLIKPLDLVVDGEIICTYKNFERFNSEYSNPRNFAAGSIRLLNSADCYERRLQFVAWDLIEGSDAKTLSDKLVELEVLGFDTAPWEIPALEYGDNFDTTIDHIKYICEQRSFPIDGLVFKYNNCQEYEEMGRTEHHFRGGLAYKFYDELYETELLNIEWSMGRTGVLTPVAIFKEIEIEGAKINRASLHNVSIMNQLLSQPFVGQKIRIFRANQIIPQVYDAEQSPYTVSTLRIKNCPICGEELELNNNDGVLTLYCPNEDCEGKLLNKLDHFCGKKGLDIKGLSKATLEKLMDWGWVENIEDIFLLGTYKQEWINKEGFGVKSVDRILAAIEDSKNTEFYQFISSLGIPLIGISVAKDLAKKFYDYCEFRDAVIDGYPFYNLPNFGDAKHSSLINFDYSSADKIYKLLNLTNDFAKQTDKTLENLTFCITGKLQFYKNRTELKNEIEKFGGKVTDSVSSKTTYLINNDINSTSSKNKTAKQLGIPIITEQQLKDMIN